MARSAVAKQVSQPRLKVSRDVGGPGLEMVAEDGCRHGARMIPHHLNAVREVPVQFPVDRRMVEGGERPIELSDAPAQILEQRVRVVRHIAKRRSRHPVQHPHEMPRRRSVVRDDPLATDALDDARAEASARTDVCHGGDLRFEERSIIQRVRHLQHEALGRRRLQQKVLVLFAWERRDERFDAVVFECDRGGVSRRHRWRLFQGHQVRL
jgi:hypothetical protein